jgi:murein DD-endopeptidase MepM/ murein hydrolase activator NlpD
LRIIYRLRPLSLSILIGLLVACQAVAAQPTLSTPDQIQTSEAVSRSSWTPIPVIQANTATTSAASITPLLATFTASIETTPTLVSSPSSTASPKATVIPTNTARPSATMLPTRAPTVISTNVPGPFGGDPATWTPPAPGIRVNEHFILQRPIGNGFTSYWARSYSYGSTDKGSYPTHHGLDMLNPEGTPVLAAADGVVYYAGADQIYGPRPDFYGNVVVIQHMMRDGDGQPIYTLYGHLSTVGVSTGQIVRTGEQVGLVGSTGVALGAHLHFEVRADKVEDYNASTLNPELWILPYPGNGVLSGRLMDLYGIKIPGMLVEVRSDSLYVSAYSYVDNTVNGDPALGENYVVPDLPPGYYTVFVKRKSDNSLAFRTMVYIWSTHITWLDIHMTDSVG